MENAEYYFDLGNEEYQKGNVSSCIEYLEKALEIDYDYVHALYGLGIVYYNTEKYSEAEAYFQKVLKIDSNNINVLILLGDIYKNLEKYSEAIKIFSLVLDVDKDNIYSLHSIGYIYFQQKEYSSSIKYYEVALKIDSDFVHSLNGLGNVYRNTNEYEKAKENFEKALKIDSDFVHSLNGLGNVYRNTKEYEKAKENYEKALKIESKNVDALYGLGNVYNETKEYEKAKENYEKALEIEQKNVDVLNNLGNVYFKLKEYEKAKENYEKALEIDSKNVEGLNHLGSVYFKLKEYEKAKENFEKNLKIDFKYVYSWYGLGCVYFNLEKYDKAVSHFQKALKIDSNFVHSWFGLGEAYSKKAIPNYALAHLCFNRFIYLATHEEFAKYGFEIITFFKDFSDAPYMLKYLLEKIAVIFNFENDSNAPNMLKNLLEKVAVNLNLLRNQSVLGTIRRQCQSIDSYLSFLKYLPFKELDEKIISHKKQIKDLESALKKIVNTGSEKDVRQQIHEQKENLATLENQFNEAFYNTNEKTVGHWQLAALVNHFMGNCIEAHRIYDEEIETHFSDEMTMMDRFYYLKSANQFLHPEANYLLNDTIENEVEKLEFNNQNPSEIYYAAQIYLMAWQSDETIEYLQKAHKLFLRADFYLPAQYMSVHTSDKLGNVEQRDKQIEKILKSKEKWFVEGWKIRPYDFENPDFLRQFKRYAHFSEVQEAINLIHTDYEKGYRFPPFYEAFEFKISDTEYSNFERFMRKRGGLEIAKSLSETLGVEVGTYKNREFIIKEKVGELGILNDIEKSTESEDLETKLVEFIFAWKLDLLPKNKIETYSDIILYAVALEKINLMTALRLLVFAKVVMVFYEMNTESKIVQKVEATIYNFGLKGIVHTLSNGLDSTVESLITNFISSFTNNIIEYRKKIFGFDMPKITASESYKRFNEYYLEDLGIKLEEFKTNKWIDEPFVENLQKDYDKQMEIFRKD